MSCEVAVRRGDQPDVDTARPRAAQPFELALLEDAQELGLQIEGMSPTSSRNSVPRCASSRRPIRLIGAGERALLVSEQFAFEQAGWNAAPLILMNGRCSPRAEIVDCAREQLLARAGLAEQQHGRSPVGRDNPGGFEDALQRPTLADDFAEAPSQAKLVLEVTRLLLQLIPLGSNRRGVLLHPVEVELLSTAMATMAATCSMKAMVSGR